MLVALLATLWSVNVSVDACDPASDIDTCYTTSAIVFRAGTSLVAQHGLLVAENDTLRKLDSMNASVVSTMAERIRLSDNISSKQDSIIKLQKVEARSAKIKVGLVSGAVGFLFGVIVSLALVVAGG